ncbi:MAG: tRNA (cytidine(34)-2'-O)-methyltransferase [Sphingomicrobium sp.]|nr:tRNA methyltransferase [Sphingomonadales bacterium]
MRIALYQPEIAGNVGAVLRLAACFGCAVDLIEPMGFAWDDKRVRRAAMDYIDHVEVIRHSDWPSFRAARPGRLALLTTRGTVSLYDASFAADDILLMGKESAGVPLEIAGQCALALRIPIRREVRSLNLATAAALALGEALRQTKKFPLVQ